MNIYSIMDREVTRYEALLASVNAAGSLSQLARDLGTSQPTVWRWVNQTKQMPAEFVLSAEHRYGISRHHLRPDIYPVETPQQERFLGVDRRAKRVAFVSHQVSKAARA